MYRGGWRGQEVAIKTMSGPRLDSLHERVRGLQKLQHPRLVRFIGPCMQPPSLLVVTEFMKGGSLHNRLIGKPFAVQRSTTALQIGEGLAFLHACRVIHRDLKSQNVLLDGTDNAKLADYGLDLEPAQQGISSHRNMAPEIFNSQPTTEKVDIWSAGCILIELFGGVTAYHDCHNFLQISARMSERRAPEIPSAVPVPVATVIRRCHVVDVSTRIHTKDLLCELGKCTAVL